MASTFRFLHAADLHLGTPFRGLALRDPDIADRFAGATRAAFTALVDRAIAEQVAFVVVAGDVYDGEWKDNSIGLFFNREAARLDRAGIGLYLLRGNHDAASVVTRSISLPDSVRDFGTGRPETFRIEELRVALHGQGFAERSAADNLALGYPAPVPGWFNIGVLHTSLTGRPPHADYAPCTVADLVSRGYDYWALGHVHEFEIVAEDPYIVYPGNPQGRSIREAGEKGAVLVSVADGKVAGVERVIVDRARWATAAVDTGGCADPEALLRAMAEALVPLAGAAEGRLVAVRLRLDGESDLHAHILAHRAQLADEAQAACHRLDPDIWLEKLVVATAPRPAAAATAADPALDIAAMLDAAAADPAVRARAEAQLETVAARLPGGLGAGDAPLGDDLDTLLAEARTLVLLSLAERR